MTTSRTTPTRASPSWASGCLSLMTMQTLVRPVEEEGGAAGGSGGGGWEARLQEEGRAWLGQGCVRMSGWGMDGLRAPLAPLSQALSQSLPQFPFLCVE